MAGTILSSSLRFAPLRTDHADRTAETNHDRNVSGLTPSWTEMFAISVLLIWYAIALSEDSGNVTLINIVGPGILSLSVALGAYRMTQRNPHSIWSALFWYRLSMAAYLGFGSLITSFLNNDTRDLIESFFAFYPMDLLKFNAVNALFHFVVLLATMGVLLGYRVAERQFSTKNLAISQCNFSLKTVGFISLTLGLTSNYLLIYPVNLGLLKFNVPNFVVQIGQLAYMGYFMLTYWGLANAKYRWIWAMLGLALIDSLAGVLLLSKYAAIFPVLMMLIGYIYHKPSMRRMLLVFAILLPFYLLVSSIVYEARDRVDRSGANNSATFADSLAVMGDIANDKAEDESGPDYQLAWSRLSFVNAGTRAISFYDQGLPGNTLRDIYVVWIPRVIYPDKPNITDIGREFTAMTNGNYESSTSPSMPSEGYWDYGWLGVCLFGGLFGFIVTMMSIYSTLVFERQAWHLLLVVLLGIRMGSRVDGVIVPDVIGPLNAVLVVHIACSLTNRFLPKLSLTRAKSN